MRFPCRGKVWFWAGKKYHASIYGTWNGWAVATMSLKHAVAMLSAAPNIEVEDITETSIHVKMSSTGTREVLPVSRKTVFFDTGWSLHHECGAGRPPPLPARWRRTLTLDPLPIGDQP